MLRQSRTSCQIEQHSRLIEILIYNANKYCVVTVRRLSSKSVSPNSIGFAVDRVRQQRLPPRTWHRRRRWWIVRATTVNKKCVNREWPARTQAATGLPPVRDVSGPSRCFSCTGAVCCPTADEFEPRPSAEVWNWKRPADTGCTFWSGSTSESFLPAPAVTGTKRLAMTPSDGRYPGTNRGMN